MQNIDLLRVVRHLSAYPCGGDTAYRRPMLFLHFSEGYDGLGYRIFGDSGPSIWKVALKTANECVRGTFGNTTHSKNEVYDRDDWCVSI